MSVGGGRVQCDRGVAPTCWGEKAAQLGREGEKSLIQIFFYTKALSGAFLISEYGKIPALVVSHGAACLCLSESCRVARVDACV